VGLNESKNMTTSAEQNEYLLASDFDQTLSFNDSGVVLSELLGIEDFEQKVAGLSASNLVQPGAELAYLLRHDPRFRTVRREHLIAAGRSVQLKSDVITLAEALHRGLDGNRFHFRVISAAPRLVVQSALAGLVPPEHIYGTELDFDEASGEIRSIVQVPAGYGKVKLLTELELETGVPPDRTIYVGDGRSDLHVMHHVNSRDGHTIAVSDFKAIGSIAHRTVLSDSALSTLLPIMEDILLWNAPQIRQWFSTLGFTLQGWDKTRTDWLTFKTAGPASAPSPAS
jgi:HAD superfamily phosphoserine phosphatase-like hydrolase